MLQTLFLTSLFGQILVSGKFTCSGPDWLLNGTICYKIVVGSLDYKEAIQTCLDLGAYVIMPKTAVEMKFAKSLRTINNIAVEVWFGLTEFQSNGIWTWADGTDASGIGIGCDADPTEDCVRLKSDGRFCDIGCSVPHMTICQRDADQGTTSIIDITSSPEITTTNPITSEGSTTTETGPFRTTVDHLSTYTETSVESSTSYSASSGSHAPIVLSTLSSTISTNSTQHCTYVFICSNQLNNTSGSQGYTYKVDTKKLSSYKRLHQSVSDPRKSSLYIGSVGIAVLVSIVLLIMFLDCVPTKV